MKKQNCSFLFIVLAVLQRATIGTTFNINNYYCDFNFKGRECSVCLRLFENNMTDLLNEFLRKRKNSA